MSVSDQVTVVPPSSTGSQELSPRVSVVRRVLPFVIAAGLLVVIGLQLDFGAFGRALTRLNYVAFLSFALGWQIALLGADALGNYASYRRTMPAVRYTDFYAFRGASYLPGMVNHHLGQAYLTYAMSKLAKLPITRVAGATLVSYAGWMGCLLGCVAVAMPLAGLPVGYLPIIAAAGVVYLVIVEIKPAPLAKISFLAPLFEAGLRGHAIALAARIPHLLVLVLGNWAAYRFFHVFIPLGQALLYLPILLVATTLPITPQGFGTREALAATFFASYAPGDTEAERLGALTASTTAWGVSITLAGILLGLVCTRIAARRLAQTR